MATISTFKKPKRNFRRKVTESDSDQDDNNSKILEADNEDSTDSVDVNEIAKKIKERKKKKDKDQTSSLLSFGDQEEEDGEVFKIKKSSHSKRLSKQLKKSGPKDKDQNNDIHMKDDSDRVSQDDSRHSDQDREDAEEKLKKLREEFRTLNGDEAARMEESDEEEDGEKVFKAMLKRGEIPDATTIHMIRKRRQQARELGDFIPIEEAPLENEKSRLVRDDDNDKSDDDDGEGRIDFSVDTEARDRKKMETEFYAAEHGSDREESDHEREWEQQQIRKGVSVQQPAIPETYEQMNVPVNKGPFSNGYTNYMDERPSFQPLTLLNRSDPSQITIEAIKRQLKERLDSMDEVHRTHEREMALACTTADETETSIETCEDKTEGLEDQYRFFQEMRGYVRDLVECLNEKVPTINDLEARMLNLLKTHSQKLLSRRQQDVRDQCQDYMTNKAKVVMESSEDQARQRRVAEREARRSRRRRARENKHIMGHHDGLSSDDEENQSDITKFNMEHDGILGTAEQLFEDVVEEFSELDYTRRKFQEWKKFHSDSYKEAYIGLCLPKLLNPFVRLSLLNWNPLEENCKDFEEMPWYETLVYYGFEDEDNICRDDDDIKLLPLVVEKIILPKLNNLVEFAWDPMSTNQTVRLVNLLHKIIKDYPTVHGDSKSTQILLNLIVQRMKKTLDDDVFMPLYPKNVLENRSSGPAVFFHRQSWTCIKLLGNIMSWVGIIANDILQRLAFDGLLNRYIILGLQTSIFSPSELLKCQAIVSTFPKQWFSELEGDKTLPHLENVCRYLIFAAASLERCSYDQKDSERKEIRDQLKQILKLLVNINAVDHASSLSDKYSIKM